MRHIPYARKKRQLKRLVRKFQKLSSESANSQQINILIQKIRKLFLQLKHYLSFRDLKRILGTTAILAALTFSQKGIAQQFDTPIGNPFGIITNARPMFPTYVDIDDDGDMDFFAGMYGQGIIYYENIGSPMEPSFGLPQVNPFGLDSLIGTTHPTFSDIDGDEDLDLLIGGYVLPEATLKYFENIGTVSHPEFVEREGNPLDLNISFNSNSQIRPEFVDLDLDGDTDLFIVSKNFAPYNTTTYFLKNIGTPSAPEFADPQEDLFEQEDANQLLYSTFSDLDDDGDLDILGFSCCDNEAMFFENISSDSDNLAFASPILNDFGLDSTRNYLDLAFSDLDSDGDMDLTGTRFTSPPTLAYFENIGSAEQPKFSDPENSPFGFLVIEQLLTKAFADLDGDGDQDMLTADFGGRSRMYYFENEGTAEEAQFGIPKAHPFGLVPVANLLAFPDFADLDGDGDLDLLLGERYGGRLFYFENTGSITEPLFSDPQILPFGLSGFTYSRATSPAFVDMDDDGDMDLLVGQSYGLLYVENKGSAIEPEFASPQENPFGLEEGSIPFVVPTLADLDKDGDFDLLSSAGGYDGEMLYFENVGTASEALFPAIGEINPFGLTSVYRLAIPTFVDLDSDGDDDLMVAPRYGEFLYFENKSPTNIANSLYKGEVHVFPNPTKDLLYIDSEEAIKFVEIYNTMGQVVKAWDKTNQTLSLTNLSSASYFLKIVFQNGHYTVRRILKE